MLVLGDKCRVREEHDGAGLVSNSKNGELFILNPVAMFILKELGKSPLEASQLVDRVMGAFRKVDRDVVQADIATFLSDAEARGVLTQCGQPGPVQR